LGLKRLISSSVRIFQGKQPEKKSSALLMFIHENNLRLEDCVSICTDGAASMTEKVKGFKARVREVNPEIRFDHCSLHREAIFAKMLPAPLKSVLDEVVKNC
jgi:predicted GTPase